MTHEVFELPPRLLDDAVLAAEDDAHATQVADLRAAHDERVDVEPSAGQDPRDAREHSWLVLHETVQYVSGVRYSNQHRAQRRQVENEGPARTF